MATYQDTIIIIDGILQTAITLYNEGNVARERGNMAYAKIQYQIALGLIYPILANGKKLDIKDIPNVGEFKMELNQLLRSIPIDVETFSAGTKEAKKKEEEVTPCPQPIYVDAEDNFSRLAGMHNEKSDMLLSFVYPNVYPKLFSKVKNILLYGPPGTGKTVLVKAAAAEIQRAGIKVSLYVGGGAEMKSKWVGGTEKTIKSYFECGQREAEEYERLVKEQVTIEQGQIPFLAIIFIDEIDAIGANRDVDANMATSVNALISSMEGIVSYDNVAVIGATNKPWSLDSALLRRFYKKIYVDLPGDIARKEVIQNRLIKQFMTIKNWYTREKEVKEAIWRNVLNLIAKYGGKFNDESLETVVEMTGAKEDAQKYPTQKGINVIVDNKEITCKDIRNIKEDAINDILENCKKHMDTSVKPYLPCGYLESRGKCRTRVAASKFGYSMSDMDKMISLAINNMAEKVIYSPIEIEKEKNKYIAKLIKKVNGEGKTCILEKNESDIKSCEITQDERNKITSYSLNLENFTKAIAAYPSTINEKEYLDYVYYYATNELPT